MSEPAPATVPVSPSSDEPPVGPYHLFMFAVGIYALLALAAQTVFSLSAETRQILDWVDNAVCALFFADFMLNLLSAPSWRSYLKWGWLDLIASIPSIGILRVGRIARIIRILRAFRSIRSARYVAAYLIRCRGDGAFFGVSMLSLLLVLFASVSILQFERDAPGANILQPQDAVWWAFTTITTVGYGDKFPVTVEGRMVAGTLMIAGVGLFGTFTGLVASWIISPSHKDKEQDTELVRLRIELIRMRDRMEEHWGRPDPVRHVHADLAEISTAWPTLSEEARCRILTAIELERKQESRAIAPVEP